MFPRLIVACCLLLGLPGLAAARSVGQIPDPRRSGSHLAETTGRADAGTRARVDELIARARGRGYATEYHTGLASVTETCVHCHYVYTYTRVIPRESRSDDSSSSSSGGSSSGRGSSGSW
jgi:hypothetical protein